MKKRLRCAAVATAATLAVGSVACGLSGCDFMRSLGTMSLDELSDRLALSMIGDDAYAWNVYSVSPEQSFGYVRTNDPSWYSYSRMSDEDIDSCCELLELYERELNKHDPAKLSDEDAIKYRAIDYVLDTYLAYYRSPYAADFTLMGGSYISSEGGYVADFAQTVENYAFRTESDVKDLLAITQSTEQAFSTYLTFAEDRDDSGHPLYDYTVCAMQDYLDEVYGQGSEYYLYAFVDNKIDSADFLSDEDKEEYKQEYETALTDCFMSGVKELSQGLDRYKGKVETAQMSYLADYGAAGKAYYQWLFQNKTGIQGANITDIYNELVTAFSEYYDEMDDILDKLDRLKSTDPQAYTDFIDYDSGEKAILGLTQPQDVIDYLKEAAKSIVPDLNNEPTIEFKYMDDTVAQISTMMAYYLHSPLDEENSVEHITINGRYLNDDYADMFTTIAHEGYPGHLYSSVKSKEQGISLLSSGISCTAFSEGWAKYVELAVMDGVAANTDDQGLRLFCEYKNCMQMVNYLSMVLYDIQVNYMGYTAQDYVRLGESDEFARYVVEAFMEMPAVYVPYGYGMYYINDLHENARSALGSLYDEVEYNGALLSEGVGPTLSRAKEITVEYIAKTRNG